MAAKQSKNSKAGRNEKKCAAYKSGRRREINKARAAATREHRLRKAQERHEAKCMKSGKPANEGGRALARIVSKQNTRVRERNFRELPFKDREGRDPRKAGERQWGDRAKGWHLHQRENRLAQALAPKEFRKIEKAEREHKDRVKRGITQHILISS